jgi:DNA-binding CsgD family transcriptional regulator
VAGKRFLTPKVSEIVLEGFLNTTGQHRPAEGNGTRTTPRETEIIRLLAAGKSNKEIAALLRITARTVETHRSKIMLKLGIHSLAELIHYALRQEIAFVKDTRYRLGTFLCRCLMRRFRIKVGGILSSKIPRWLSPSMQIPS